MRPREFRQSEDEGAGCFAAVLVFLFLGIIVGLLLVIYLVSHT